ncbi:phosphoglycerate kinase [Candidatus Nomurabacteria bacterium RIFCSPHIGHO2_01_FULL_38_19]|uniref:Phosphoglycerate kinase n=1 Tax=Candidatus Nomurabacteria bacterium RIFCSPHIGHO2_01_FULL_38_19 TaxID=1801732 RepID=A0A1F6UUH6_9BACT|nr:MAG: phosphoglycerate kinase [Candidatus Nomurabacteria bacterium RIFCSPHIGHO2_01_FULL_38_19]
MKLKTLENINLKNKTVLYRAPYDIETETVNGVLELGDDMRIKATIPTLQYLLKENCKIVILTYVGRPDGKIVENLRTTSHAKKLSELLNHPVLKVDDSIGPLVQEKITQMKSGDILMLENVRFYKEEMVDDDEFAKKLCLGKDLIVFDGFPQAHRIHASTTGIERHLPTVAGFYLQHEVEMLSNLLENPQRPFTVIIGGAKISDKVDAIHNLLKMADNILIGGAVANVFLKALGRELGSSFVEDVFVDKVKREKRDWVEDAKDILKQAEALGKKIITPVDLVLSDTKVPNSAIAENSTSKKIININKEAVPFGWMALDIGPETQKEFSDIILQSKTVFLAGPIGKFENERFAEGSKALLTAMKKVNGETIIAGGDTIDVAGRYTKLDDYTHISLAGGATLEFLAGKELPALKALMQ